MSIELKLVEQIQGLIQTNIRSFVDLLAEKYELDKKEIYSLWGTTKVASKSSKNTGLTADTEDISPERLLKSTKNELSALCKAKGLKCSGKKEDLISRLLGKEVAVEKKPRKSKKKAEEEEDPQSEEDVEPEEKKPSRAKVVSKSKTSQPAVLKKLISDTSTSFLIRKNEFGNPQHAETRLVFDPKTKKVIGKQEDDGTVADLTDEDIEECKKYKFQWVTPKSLEKQNLDNVKIEELDDVIVEEDAEVEEEEIEDDEEDSDAIVEDD